VNAVRINPNNALEIGHQFDSLFFRLTNL
jgi:hypothetical protein